MPIVVRRLRPEDDRSLFDCGDIDLDRFFRRFAGQNQFKHYVGTTYVAVEESLILGFATVSPSQIDIEDLPTDLLRRLPKYPPPVLRLARLGVDRQAQGRGIGLTLLRSVFGLARQMAEDFGCIGLMVDAKPNAVPFYERYGFIPLEILQGHLGDRPRPLPMFLELGAIPPG